MRSSQIVILLSLNLLWLSTGVASVKQGLEFSEKCSAGSEITISAVGDVLLHSTLQLQSFNSPQTYKSLWPSMISIFNKFDISYANFEGPSAEGLLPGGKQKNVGFHFDPEVYTSFPSFNYHPHVVKDLKESGIDIVSTANNHALDRRKLGADMTLESMKEYGLLSMGTRAEGETNSIWHTTTETNGHRIAWLACTFSTNGIPDSGHQVLPCYQNRQFILNYVHELAQNKNYSAVIVTPHWGNEYEQSPAKQEIAFGRQLIDSGALAVIGTHPHVVQPWEKYQSPVSGKEGLIVYSTGNFVSGQFHKIPTQVGMMIGLKLIYDPASNQLKIKTAKYLPLLMKRRPYRVEPVISDAGVPTMFTSIWNEMYPAQNRIRDLDSFFPNECP